MSSLTPKSPYADLHMGLPASPRPSRQLLSPINTNFPYSLTTTPTTSNSEKTLPQAYMEPRARHPDSRIFVNATIPVSPSSSGSFTKGSRHGELDGLAPRKRSGFSRLFCCLGRKDRTRTESARHSEEYEKVGDNCHWTEY